MWLINTHTLELHSFSDVESAPDYAILSHCWGKREMTFKDFRKRRNCAGAGYQKIVDCCRTTRDFPLEYMESVEMLAYRSDTSGFDWVWIDTVCIDKRSSAELSEAINSSKRSPTASP